ncbi:hypothetical protein DERP_001398, partial [Dermatophagoides pteronyssinus]
QKLKVLQANFSPIVAATIVPAQMPKLDGVDITTPDAKVPHKALTEYLAATSAVSLGNRGQFPGRSGTNFKNLFDLNHFSELN